MDLKKKLQPFERQYAKDKKKLMSQHNKRYAQTIDYESHAYGDDETNEAANTTLNPDGVDSRGRSLPPLRQLPQTLAPQEVKKQELLQQNLQSNIRKRNRQ